MIWMFTVAETPEHVLHPIRRVVEQKEESFLEAVELKTHHALALFEYKFALSKIGGFVQAAIVQSIVVLRHTEGGEEPDFCGQVLGIGRGRRYGKHRGRRIEVHSGDVELNVRFNLPNVESRDTRD